MWHRESFHGVNATTTLYTNSSSGKVGAAIFEMALVKLGGDEFDSSG
jgi:hypothetical protein